MHGYERDTTPAISDFAARATVYKQAKAPGAWTLASHTSMFTGYHVDEHRLTYNDHAVESGHTIWEVLSDHNYRTGVFSHNPFLTGGTGLEAGFDTVVPTDQSLPYPDAVDPYEYPDDYLEFVRTAIVDGSPVRSALNGVVAKYEPDILDGLGDWEADKTPARRCADEFLDWHASVSGSSWGACLNLMDAHWPYRPVDNRWADDETIALAAELETESLWQFEGGQRPWSEWEAMEDLYDGCIRQADAAVGHMLQHLDERGAIDGTIVIITADHGEAFGESSAVRDVRVREHGSGAIHDSVIHVPLVVHWPGSTGAPEVNHPVSLTWLRSVIEEATSGPLTEDPLHRPGTPVIASTHGLSADEQKYQTAADYVDDMRPFSGHARAVYEAAGDGARKYVDVRRSDGSRRSATVHVDNTGEAIVESDTDSGRVSATFADIENAGVRVDSVTIDEQMKSRLVNLGYM